MEFGTEREIMTTIRRFSPDEFDRKVFAEFLHAPLNPGIRDFLEDRLIPGISGHEVRYHYMYLPVMKSVEDPPRVYFTGLNHFSGAPVHALLSRCYSFILFLASSSSPDPADPWQDYIAKIFINTLVHLRIREMASFFRSQYRCFVTPRYAPGYCGWPLSDQKTVLNLLDPGQRHVQITDAGMLIPVQSVTGIYGLAAQKFTIQGIPCLHCRREDCVIRWEWDNKKNK